MIKEIYNRIKNYCHSLESLNFFIKATEASTTTIHYPVIPYGRSKEAISDTKSKMMNFFAAANENECFNGYRVMVPSTNYSLKKEKLRIR
ncbi:hypothetical protein ABRY23_02085 [Melioribacteraceae bacterium 4301-Me]|uniref:hypothetical protein n=1 Tax=Pyranulibacter aquaticus TaxID=3163344 RepID=UPI003596ACD0